MENLDQYKGLAYVYDQLLAGVDYEEWADYILHLCREHSYYPSSVLDLACGTGSSTLPWAKRSLFPVAGLDLSREMIGIAQKKAKTLGLPVKYYCQDMRSFKLNQSFDLCLIYQDGLNYLLSVEDIGKTLSRVREHLTPGGLFVFDLNMVEKLPVTNDPQLCWADEDDMTLIWETSFDEKTRIWEIELTAFVKDGYGYQKFKEKHREKSHQVGEIKGALDRYSWDVLGCYQAFTTNTPLADSRHLVFIARPGG